LGLHWEIELLKPKKSILDKASFLSFSQKCVLAIFRVKSQRSTFKGFLPNKSTFVWHNFLGTKSTFKLPNTIQTGS